MTQFTLNDLAVRTLRDLNIYDAEATPTAADLDFVKETIRSEFARLEADGIIMWSTSVDSINNHYLTTLSGYMGGAIGPAFGVMSKQASTGVMQYYENILRRLGAPVKTPEVLTIERAARGTRIRDPIINQ